MVGGTRPKRATTADGLSQRFTSLSTITNRQQSTEDPGGETLDYTHDAVVANIGEVANDIHHVALPPAVVFERNPPRSVAATGSRLVMLPLLTPHFSATMRTTFVRS